MTTTNKVSQRETNEDGTRPAVLGESIIDGDELRDAAEGEPVVDCGGMTMTVEAARSCGLLPQQILARRRESVAVLDAYGHGGTAEAHVLRADVARREGLL